MPKQSFGHFRTRGLRISARFLPEPKSPAMQLSCLLYTFYLGFGAIVNMRLSGFDSRYPLFSLPSGLASQSPFKRVPHFSTR